MVNLVELHEHENSNEVHEGCIKLESDIGGTNMITARHDTLHEQCQSHGKVETILSGHTILVLVNVGVVCQELSVSNLLEQHYQHEEEAKDTVAKVAKHMIEVSDKTQRFPAEIIVVTNVLVTSDTLFIGERENHL